MNEQELKEQLKQEIKQEMKKSARKKRIIIFAILLVIIAGLFICYKIESKREAELNKQYTYEELSQYKKEIPITMENWKDYITTEERKEDRKDNFGNIINKYEKTELKLKDNICGYVVLEVNVLTNKYNFNKKQSVVIIGGKTTFEGLTIDGEETKEGDITIYNKKFTLDDLEILQLKGYIYTIDIPEEMWRTNKNTGKKYMHVENDILYQDYSKEDSYYYYINRLSNIDYQEYKEQIGK